jgi:hypothetical protein
MSNTKHNLTLIASIAAAVLVQGCSGGGGGMNGGPAVAQAPRISGLSALNVDQDTTGTAQGFRIDDADTPVAQLELSIATSDPVLLPLRGLVVEGSGADRTLRVTPAAESTGNGTVTLTVRDPSGLTALATVDVRVNPVLVSFSSVANTAFAAATDGAPAKVSGVTVQPDLDDDPAAFDTILQQGVQ